MDNIKVIYTDNVFGDSSIESSRYSEMGYQYIEATDFDEATLIKECADANAVVCCYAKINSNVIEAMNNCKVIVKAGMGVNNIDIETASEKGIMVANVQKYCLEEVSDHALALALTLIRKTAFMDRKSRNGEWTGAAACRPIYRISEMKFCLYGFGDIARQIAKKAKAVGFKVAAYDPYLEEKVFKEAEVEHIENEEDIFKEADVLAVQLNLNKDTEGIISYKKIKLMKSSSIFINTARGGLVDEKGLIKALSDKTIGGAGLDVLAEEYPDMDSPIFKMENVCITPHIAYYSTGADIDLRNGTCDQVIEALEHGKPKFLLNTVAI